VKLVIIFIFFFIISSKSFSSEINCSSYSLFKNEKNQIEYIELVPNKYRDFKLTQLKNLVSLEDDLGENLHISKQKQFKTLIKIFFENKEKCIIKAKIRVHGDGRDHYKFEDGNVFSSLNVNLENTNLYNAVKFKLFLPDAEGGDSEIFNSVIFRELDFIAPETRYLNVKIGNKKFKYLFQEALAKEMLEKNNRREGPILEVDEENTFGLMRIDNKKWASMNIDKSSKILGDINHEMMALKNNFYLNHQKDLYSNALINYRILSNNIQEQYKKLSNFVLLALASGSEHMFSFNDMRFYYDTIYGVYYPIYYDAEPKLDYDLLSLPRNISNYFNIDGEELKKKLSELNIIELNNKLNLFGLRENEKKTKERLDEIYNNLDKIITKDKIKIDPKSYEFENLEQYYKNKKLFFVYNDENNNFILCNFVKNNCVNKSYTQDEKLNFLRQRYKQSNKLSNKPQFTFFGKTKNVSSKNIPRGIYGWQKKILDKGVLIFFLNSETKINFEKKTVDINLKDKKSRIVITGNESIIKNWTINLNAEEFLKEKNNLIDLQTNLTGCLTFLDTKVENIDIYSKNLFCEDSVNFIRTSGTINKMEIYDSLSDGLDMDFSNLNVNKLKVFNSQNDCVDFSYGTYLIKEIEVKNCGDKALSVGEKSIVKINELNASYSNFGAVSKDSSETIINDAKISYVKYCLGAYNKKSEFNGATLIVKKIDCNNYHEKLYKDDLSEIIIK
jgi:hypothetical protein